MVESKCVLWTGAKAGNGYGVKNISGKNQYAHRLAAEQAYGPIPAGMVVAHTCDTPSCVNPAHLFICTQRENLQDMWRKGRGSEGDRHRSRTHPELVLKGSQIGNSKLTESDVLVIRATYKKSDPGKPSKTSLSYLADKYGVCFQTIHEIVTRKKWRHI